LAPGSLLWFLSWNDAGKQTLRRHAESYGVDADRLVFTTFFKEECVDMHVPCRVRQNGTSREASVC
jgi:predicted O-linked N-acetylglucosamine transferase (SPINDLY family)